MPDFQAYDPKTSQIDFKVSDIGGMAGHDFNPNYAEILEHGVINRQKLTFILGILAFHSINTDAVNDRQPLSTAFCCVLILGITGSF